MSAFNEDIESDASIRAALQQHIAIASHMSRKDGIEYFQKLGQENPIAFVGILCMILNGELD